MTLTGTACHCKRSGERSRAYDLGRGWRRNAGDWTDENGGSAWRAAQCSEVTYLRSGEDEFAWGER